MSKLENGLSDWYDRLRITPDVVENTKLRDDHIPSKKTQQDIFDSSESEEEFDITKLDRNYEESEKYCEIIENWIRKVEDIDEDPFSDYYGFDIEGNNNCEIESIDLYDGFSLETASNYKFVWEGPTKHSKPFHGRGTVIFSNGDEMTGVWKNGVRQGRFSTTYSNNNIATIDGDYSCNHLNGSGGVTFTDGSTIVGEFRNGCLHGLTRVMNCNGCIEWAGRYCNGRRCGTWWQFKPGGGVVTGMVDSNGNLTGENIIYIYPDFCTCLIGRFENGDFRSGYQANITELKLRMGILEISARPVDKIKLRYQLSTTNFICHDYLQTDPYESKTVVVLPSLVGEGEGLFARIEIPEGRTVAFYNGIRILPQEGDEHESWEDCSYRIFVDPDAVTDILQQDMSCHTDNNNSVSKNCKEKIEITQERMDIPLELRSIDKYCATLAHKVNHSFNANCEFSGYEHPLYGKIPCVTTIQKVQSGEELTCFYRYSLTDCPEWYSKLWESLGDIQT